MPSHHAASRLALLIAAVLFAARPLRAQTDFEDASLQAAGLLAASKDAARKTPAQVREPALRVIPHFQQKRFPPAPGAACSLKSYTLLDYEIRTNDGEYDRSRLTEMAAVVETTSPECVRDYAVVQFIRGCVYHTRYSPETGSEIEKVFDVARRLRGPRVVFSHPKFEVDQTETDPLYVSYPKEEEDRLALLYVPKSLLRLRPDERSMLVDLKTFDNPSSRTFLKDLEGPTSLTFVTDLPEGGVVSIDEEKTRVSASNSSLDFRTCLYRVKDVPTTGDPSGEDVPQDKGGPIQCFSWMSRYTYDGATKDFTTDRFAGVDPFCAQAPERVPLPGS